MNKKNSLVNEALSILENDPIQKEIDFKGIPLAIEWLKGSTRQYADGFKKLMVANYGYVKGTLDYDGEEVDVYVGDNLESDRVFKLRQLDHDHSYTVDEVKWMMGFDSREEAIKVFVKSTEPWMFGGIIDELTIEEFKNRMIANQANKTK